MTDMQRKKANAYLVGGGIAALASAVYLIREGGLSGERIHIFEQAGVTGGALDGSGSPEKGYLIRGGRMMEAHFVYTWDLLSGIPSLDDPNRTVKDECDEFNRRLVTHSHCRLLRDGEKVDVSSYGLSDRDRFDMLKLMFRSEESLGDMRIADCFAPAFFNTTFWTLWQTTFAFQTWSSAAEMRRYCIRFIHLLPGFNQLKGILRTVYNQYDSVTLPIETWLKDRGVNFLLQTCVTDVEFDLRTERKSATAIRYADGGGEQRIELDAGAYVFITNGSMVESSTAGSMSAAPVLGSKADAGAWALWARLAEKSTDFGRPSTFCDHVDLSKWESFTVTLKDSRFFDFMQTFTGNIAGTGGLITFTDSIWLMSVVLAHQPHFRGQPETVHVFWGYGLFPDKPGDRVNKKMSECTGGEIIEELCYHLKITDKEGEYFAGATCIRCMMPFIDSQFLPRKPGDRPRVVPDGATNFAFVGQFTELADDCVFTVEYSVRTAQTAVYTLLELDKAVSPVYQGHHDIHVLIDALSATRR